jgi:hypothetical protein
MHWKSKVLAFLLRDRSRIVTSCSWLAGSARERHTQSLGITIFEEVL